MREGRQSGEAAERDGATLAPILCTGNNGSAAVPGLDTGEIAKIAGGQAGHTPLFTASAPAAAVKREPVIVVGWYALIVLGFED